MPFSLLAFVTKAGFPWSPDHLKLPNQASGSGFGWTKHWPAH